MGELLNYKNRVAAKEHICDYCGEVIQKGEEYSWSRLAWDGRLYDWKAHLKCDSIAQSLWKYIDPLDGMTEDDFQEGVEMFCQSFICPECDERVNNRECCNKRYCLDKVDELLNTHKLVFDKEKGDFILKEREKPHKAEESPAVICQDKNNIERYTFSYVSKRQKHPPKPCKSYF